MHTQRKKEINEKQWEGSKLSNCIKTEKICEIWLLEETEQWSGTL